MDAFIPHKRLKSHFDIIRKSGITNINLDLMFGLPDQTLEDLKETLDEVLSLSPDHISAYSLKIEEDTPFEKMLDKRNLGFLVKRKTELCTIFDKSLETSGISTV